MTEVAGAGRRPARTAAGSGTPPAVKDPPDAYLATVHIKGAGVNVVREYLDSTFGPGSWQRTLAMLPSDSRRILGGRILDSQWVAMLHVSRQLIATETLLGKGDGELMVVLGGEVARATFSGIYKVFARLVNPVTMLRRVNVMFKSFSDRGRYDVVVDGDTVSLTLVDVSNCWSSCRIMTGFIRHVTLSRNPEARVEHVTCEPRGDPHCSWRVVYPGLARAKAEPEDG